MTRADQLPATPGDATLAMLWERIRQQGDMPGFTRAVSAVLGAMRGEDEQEFDMSQTVLSDPVLTQKVLRLANSGMYSAFGQKINTVSKAVMVLGPEAIGQLALGLKLIEELSSSADPSLAHVEMEKAVLAGMVAQQVAASAAARDPEEAVVCSMLHTLGRMMITYYMPEQWRALQEHGGAGGEDNASVAVLGLSMERIGRAAAEHWGLPKNLMAGMRRIEPAPRTEALSDEDWLAALSTMASQCANSMWNDDDASADAVRALASSYSAMLGVAPDGIMLAIEKAKMVAAADLSIAPLAKPAEKLAKALATTRMRAYGNKVLISGLADMREVAATATPSQMMLLALETVYQGLTFSRAIVFMRNRRRGKYAAKLGVGENANHLMAQMVFDDVYEPNVFHAALNSDRVIFIENARDPKFAAKLPAWWKATLSDARSFVILPLCANGQPAGFIYGDWDVSFPAIQLNQIEFSLLNDVRVLAVKTVERRQQADVVAALNKAG